MTSFLLQKQQGAHLDLPYLTVNKQLIKCYKAVRSASFGRLIALSTHRSGGYQVKKLIMIATLALLATPSLVKAYDKDDHWDHDGDKDHKWVRADQLAGIGLGSAALIGVAGYLILRKRNASV